MFLTVLAAACSDERGLPPGFLERAAQESPAPTDAGSNGPPAMPLADGQGGPPPPSAEGASGGSSAPTQAPILSGTSAADPASIEEADRVTSRLVTAVVEDLDLGQAKAVSTPGGDLPHQRRAQESRFDAFRSECRRYHQLRQALLPYGEKLASGAATPEERRAHDRLDEVAKAEQARLSRLMWRPGLNAEDRAAMSWIMFAPTAAPAPSQP
jgi:hypothetical protein